MGVLFVDAEDTSEIELLKELEKMHDDLIEQDLILVQVEFWFSYSERLNEFTTFLVCYSQPDQPEAHSYI